MSADTDGFEIDADIDHDDAQDIQAFNSTLVRLRERRLTEITISGPLLKSKLAWKIATYQQSVLYRVVMLASGCAANWNGRNLLCAYYRGGNRSPRRTTPMRAKPSDTAAVNSTFRSL